MNGRIFRLAPMSTAIRVLTIMLWGLPLVFVGIALRGPLAAAAPGIFVATIYAWIWLRFRPTRFVVTPPSIEVVWPLKRRRIERGSITGVRIMRNVEELRDEIGWGCRVGAGGLWGGFGWLWTTRRGIVQMYISRTDEFVWIERGRQRPWLVTPERPDEFVRVLQAS